MCQNHYANKEVGSRDLLLPVLELAAWRAFRVNWGGGGCVTQNPDSLVPVLGLAQVASDRNPAGTNLVENNNSLQVTAMMNKLPLRLFAYKQ